jgi:cytochrome c peroxidase
VRRQHLSFRSPLPYFHNGFAKDLWAAVDFYNTRFNLKLSKQERSDLVAFLGSL